MRLEGLIGVTEVARRLGVRRITVWRRVKAGKLKPSLTINGKVYFQESDFSNSKKKEGEDV